MVLRAERQTHRRTHYKQSGRNEDTVKGYNGCDSYFSSEGERAKAQVYRKRENDGDNKRRCLQDMDLYVYVFYRGVHINMR